MATKSQIFGMFELLWSREIGHGCCGIYFFYVKYGIQVYWPEIGHKQGTYAVPHPHQNVSPTRYVANLSQSSCTGYDVDE